MNQDVIVKVKGKQMNFSEDEVIEMITTGHYFEKNGKIYIKYEDTSLDDNEVTSTTIKIDHKQVSILRHGATNTQMIFEEDKEHYTPYETPLGFFEMTLRTRNIHCEISEDQLNLQVDYTIDINDSGGSEAQFFVEVTSQQ